MQLIKLTEEQVSAQWGHRKEFAAEFRAAAKRGRDGWEIETSEWAKLSRKHARPEKHSGRLPTQTELASDYTTAVAPWIARGRRCVTRQQSEARIAACAGCQWAATLDDRARCDHPERQCARLFPWLRGEVCKLGRWPSLTG